MFIFILLSILFSQVPEAEKLFDSAANKFLNQDWEGAIKDLEKVLKLEPGNVHAQNLLIRAYVRSALELKAKGEYEKALLRIKKAEELQPESSEVISAKKEIQKAIERKKKEIKEAERKRKLEEERRRREEEARRKILEEQRKWVERLRRERKEREKEFAARIERIKKEEEILRDELLIARKELRVVGLRWLIVYVITVIGMIIGFSKVSSKMVNKFSENISRIVDETKEEFSGLISSVKREEPIKRDFEMIQSGLQEVLREVKTKPVIPPQEEALMKQIDSLLEIMNKMQKPKETVKYVIERPVERDMITDILPQNRERAKSVEALERTVKDPKMAIRIFTPFLNDPDNRVRANAVKAIYKYDPEGAISVLRDMASNENRWMRLSAAWVCGEIAAPEISSILEALIEDGDLKVRKRAIDSAIKLHKVLRERMPATLRLKIKRFEEEV